MTATKEQVEAFKRDFPERAQQAAEEGAEQERQRWRGIEAVASDLGAGYEPLIQAMKADGRCDGSALAMAAVATMKPGDANQSLDRVAIQREANHDWSGNASLRHAFNGNQRMYVEYRVALAKAT